MVKSKRQSGTANKHLIDIYMIDNKENNMRHPKPITTFSVFLLTAIFLIMVPAGGNLFGQGLAGTWMESKYNAKMVLSADGTYTLQYPNGFSRGRYSLNGQVFCMQDASGANPVCYTVVGYSGNKLTLRDVNGVLMNYQRQGGGRSAVGGREILAQKDGHALSQNHFNAGLGILQFIIGQKVKPSESIELRTKVIEEFRQAPAEVIRQLTVMGQSLQTVRSATDPVRIGLVRQELFAALYKATMNFKEEDKPLMIQVMNRYIKVLAFDPQTNLLLTDKDVEGMLNYITFNSELMGQKDPLTDIVRRSVRTDLVKGFPSMPLEQKRLLCTASLIWELLGTNWNRLTPAQKQQYKQAYFSQIGQNTQSYQTYKQTHGSRPANKSGSGKSTADMMREHRAKQHMFQMMNEMNMNTHATSLNIIENIGGTGNYWNVVDY